MSFTPPSWQNWLADLRQQRGVFMTGTDTGVGKTYIGTRLIQQLRAQGCIIQPRKPAESGWPTDMSDMTQTDAWQLLQAAGLPEQQLKQVCRYQLKAALSPARAAQLEGIPLSINDLTEATLFQTQDAWLYVEGAGGFYSPLTMDGLNADLAQALQLPIILVAEDKLGCMNHVLLSAEAIQHRHLILAGVILNPRTPNIPEMDNQYDLQQRLDIPVYRWPISS